jgi:hypothetical protein
MYKKVNLPVKLFGSPCQPISQISKVTWVRRFAQWSPESQTTTPETVTITTAAQPIFGLRIATDADRIEAVPSLR